MAAIEATVLPLSMCGPSSAPLNSTKVPRAGSDGRSETPMGIKIANAPRVDEYGFTMVSKHNKRGPIKLQSKNQKPQGWAPLAKQQGTHVEVINEPRVPPIAPKKVNSGFNYSRAVHGGKGSPRQQRDLTHQVANSNATCIPTSTPPCLGNGVGSSNPSIYLGFDSENRFSVLDIPSSINFNKLMVGQDDLYPPDSGLADSMDVEMNALNSKENVEFMSNRKYGITDAQKLVILNCIRDFNILYPEEDTEIVDDEDMDGFESAHAVSHLKKLGSYSDPVVTKSPNHLSPSALLPRRSTRGAAKLTNPSEGVASVTLEEPPVGPIDLQEGLTSALQPPILSSITDVCDTNKESSGIPSVSVSLTASDQVLGSFPRDGSEKTSSAVAGNRVAGKTGPAENLVLAGNTARRSDLGSSGSPGYLL
ncbi:hypothetical protein L1987_79580 [Smallanthus sonchifolius]|uniref:Uncharacterized protein n=1 Tax=Smallanthus sonchifolius TaxID=185202 RepID=A0ACB8YKB5_9ASTR|nr:hypothetical protein L1987_79580 [Smallanthus sonchifolius]